MPEPARTLINTVGTSLLFPNLAGLDGHADPELGALGAAFRAADWDAVSSRLQALPADSPLLGAETAAIRNLKAAGLLASAPHLVFLHSATEHGRVVARLLGAYHGARGAQVHLDEIACLQEHDPRAFVEQGLPGLGLALRRWLGRAPGPAAVNATGGRKAVVAVAVAVGLAERVPVYYQHERFDTVIRIPEKVCSDGAEPGSGR